jgi:hypothetical protein
MSRILRAIAILFVITAVVFAAGCSTKQDPKNNFKETPEEISPATPVVTPAVTSSDNPQLIVSPDNKFPVMEPNAQYNEKVTINSTLGDAYNVKLYAHSSDKRLAVYIDEKEGGPFVSDKILKGNGQSTNVSIQTSRQITNGNYTIYLESTYHDINNNEYPNSNSIIVIVHQSWINWFREILNI